MKNFDQVEISMNTSKDINRFGFSEMVNNPFDWIEVLFLRITGLASREDVTFRIWASMHKRIEMFLNQNFSFLRWVRGISAIRTTIIPIFKRVLPIIQTECVRERLFTCIAQLNFGASFFWIVFSGALSDFTNFIRIALDPIFNSNFSFTRIRFFPSLATRTYFFWMTVCPSVIFRFGAIKTSGCDTDLHSLVFDKIGARIPSIANVTYATNWKRLIDHRSFTLAILSLIEDVSNLLRLGFQSGNYADLAHAQYYTTKWSAVQ